MRSTFNFLTRHRDTSKLSSSLTMAPHLGLTVVVYKDCKAWNYYIETWNSKWVGCPLCCLCFLAQQQVSPSPMEFNLRVDLCPPHSLALLIFVSMRSVWEAFAPNVSSVPLIPLTFKCLLCYFSRWNRAPRFVGRLGTNCGQCVCRIFRGLWSTRPLPDHLWYIGGRWNVYSFEAIHGIYASFC